MIYLILKRILVAIPTLFAIIALVFFMVHLAPGNPFDGERALSDEAMDSLLAHYRLDLPVWQQFTMYINDLLHGQLGESMKYRGQMINDLLFPKHMGGFWVTLRLSLLTMAVAVPVGILVGAYAGMYRDSWFDRLLIALNICLSAIPTIVTGPLLVLVFAVTLQWFPAGSWGDGGVYYLFLPVSVLVLSFMPSIAFVTRGAMVEVLQSSYIRTARAKGLGRRQILFKHAIRPVMIPVASLLGPMFASILVGAVVTEQIFTLPGLGVLTTTAATNRDYNLIMAITIVSSVLIVTFNVLVDLIYMWLDPQIKV